MVPADALMEAARALAIRTGAKIGSPPRELVRRAKSQAYLFGRLSREFPAVDATEIRDVIERLRWEDLPDTVPAKQERAPTRGHEAVQESCWDSRVTQLLKHLGRRPLGTPELLQAARAELSWSLNFAIQVMAAAEERGALVYRSPVWVKARWLSKAGRVQLALFGAPVAIRVRRAKPQPTRKRELPPVLPGQLPLFEWAGRAGAERSAGAGEVRSV